MSRARFLRSGFSKFSRFNAPVRILIFILILLVLWLPLATMVYVAVHTRSAPPAEISNTISILTMLVLYVEFVLLVRVWGCWVYDQPHILQHYGLDFSGESRVAALAGLTLGISSLFALFLVQSGFGWLTWRSPSSSLLQTILEGLLISLAVAFAEELLFRGWLLDELQRDYHPSGALWLNATSFAIVHGLKPQFPALVLLGITLIWAKWATVPSAAGNSLSKQAKYGRLGLPMGLHAGLVWGYYIVNVGQLAEYTNRVPAWVTGIDRNPLAGIMGLLFLSLLALLMRRLVRLRQFAMNRR